MFVWKWPNISFMSSDPIHCRMLLMHRRSWWAITSGQTWTILVESRRKIRSSELSWRKWSQISLLCDCWLITTNDDAFQTICLANVLTIDRCDWLHSPLFQESDGFDVGRYSTSSSRFWFGELISPFTESQFTSRSCFSQVYDSRFSMPIPRGFNDVELSPMPLSQNASQYRSHVERRRSCHYCSCLWLWI
jgi:hypothetical protein